MKLWVVMIVKDEEACLRGCLESVKDADGIVILDTGSTDKTVEIAREYTPHVFAGEYTWNDDFAEARNYALSKVPDPEDYWVLSIDADGTLEAGGIQKLKEAMQEYWDKRTIYVRLAACDGSSEHYFPQMFRKGVRWVGAAHEAPNVADNNPVDVTITYTYSPAHGSDPDRMLRILTKATEKDRSPRNVYYLAREYWYRKKLDVAAILFQEVTLKSLWKPEKADAFLYLARCYWALCKGDSAREACAQALLINSNFKEACLFMAELSWDYNAPQWRRMADTADNSNVLFIRTP